MSDNVISIEKDLEQARTRLGNHLDELTRRLSPGQLLDEALSYLRNGQAAVFVQNLGAGVRDNPLPVAVTGIGLTWLAVASSLHGRQVSEARALVPYSGVTGSEEAVQPGLSERARQAAAALSRATDETEDAFHARAADAQAQVLGLKRQAEEAASAFAERVQQALQSAQDSVRDNWHGARRTAQQWQERGVQGTSEMAGAAERGRQATGIAAMRTREATSRAASGLAAVVGDNPLLLAAMGMSAGALLAAVLPQSSEENAWLARPAQQAADAAGDAVSDVADRGLRAAEAAAKAGVEAFQKKPAAQTPDEQTPVAQTPEAQTPEAQTPETKTPEAQTPEAQTPEAETPETETPETQTPDAQTPRAQTPQPQNPEHQRAAARRFDGQTFPKTA